MDIDKPNDGGDIGGCLTEGDQITEREGADAAGEQVKPPKDERLSSSAARTLAHLPRCANL